MKQNKSWLLKFLGIYKEPDTVLQQIKRRNERIILLIILFPILFMIISDHMCSMYIDEEVDYYISYENGKYYFIDGEQKSLIIQDGESIILESIIPKN